MKKLTLTIIALRLAQTISAQLLCPLNNSETCPRPPYEPTPTYGLNYMLNSFEWDATQPSSAIGLTFERWRLSGLILLDGNGTVITDLTNPFDDDNVNGNDILVAPSMIKRDVYAENGWQLLAANLGTTPADYSLGIPSNPAPAVSMPYVILYNKRTGLLRFFGTRSYSPINYQNVEISLRFLFGTDVNGPMVNGVLRYHGGEDITLDQNTNVRSVFSKKAYYNNPRGWFYADFQMAYDPCICNYYSSLIFSVKLENTTTYEMYERSISLPYNFLDDSGRVTLNNGYLPGVSDVSVGQDPNGVYEYAGLGLYQNAMVLADQYRAELRRIQERNQEIEGHNTAIEHKLSVLNTIKVISEMAAEAAEFIILPESEITEVAGQVASFESTAGIIVSNQESNSIALFTQSVHQLPQFEPSIASETPTGLHIDIKKLSEIIPKILGKGMDLWIDHVKEGEQTILKEPAKPIGSMSESTFKGVSGQSSAAQDITIFTPGAKTPQDIPSYTKIPVYNEILGVFALLEKPKIQYSLSQTVEKISDQYIPFVWGQSYNFPISNYPPYCADYLGRSQEWKVNQTIRAKLKEPLKFVINPAIGEISHQEVFATLMVSGDIPGSNHEEYFQLPGLTYGPGEQLRQYVQIESEVESANISGGPDGVLLSGPGGELRWESVRLPLNSFNDMVCGIEINTDYHSKDALYKWDEFYNEMIVRPFCSVADGYNYPAAALTARAEEGINLDVLVHDINLHLKLELNITYAQPDRAGEFLTLRQVFIYSIDNGSMELVDSEISIPWSATSANPNGNGSFISSAILNFGEKTWNANDYNTFGGINQTIVRPYAPLEISIDGNQNIDTPITEVIFTAGQEISVHGEAIISPGFTLRIDNYANMTASETPPITASYLESYCQGGADNYYHANFTREASSNIESYIQVKPSPKYRKDELLVYPIPSSDFINISLSSIGDLMAMDIYDLMGRKVQISPHGMLRSANQLIVNISTLSNGYYLVRCQMKDGSTISKRVEILH